ncbi:hypothetical protein FACS189485_19710 [Spirochaetia bacterium]|nr:hypothetical protein FACS189485_19710 [Spirochaetia bacterium]
MGNEENTGLAERKDGDKQDLMFKAYYSEDTLDPIPMNQLVKRIRKSFSAMDKTSAAVMLDLFFLHQNWASFYKREDSFSRYVKEELKISRTYAYSILNSVKCLVDYYGQKGKDAPQVDGFIADITNSIDNLGIRKLYEISTIRDEKQKFLLLEKAIEGVAIPDEELAVKKQKAEKIKISDLAVENNQLMFENKPILVFPEELDEKIRDYIVKSVSRFLQKK